MTVTITFNDKTQKIADGIYGAVDTDWYRWNEKTETWDFNHRQKNYYSTQDAPEPVSDFQKRAWKGAKWRRKVEIRDSSMHMGNVSLRFDPNSLSR